jgi:hypothetical protein
MVLWVTMHSVVASLIYQQNYSAGNGVVTPNFGYSSNSYNGVVEGTLANNEVTWEKEKN